MSWWIFSFPVNIPVMTLKKKHSVLVLVNFLSKENCPTSFCLKSFSTSTVCGERSANIKQTSDQISLCTARRTRDHKLIRGDDFYRCWAEYCDAVSLWSSRTVLWTTTPPDFTSSGGGDEDWVHINVWTAPLRQKVWNNSSSHTWRRTCRIQLIPTQIWHFLQHFQPSPRWRGQGLH